MSIDNIIVDVRCQDWLRNQDASTQTAFEAALNDLVEHRTDIKSYKADGIMMLQGQVRGPHKKFARKCAIFYQYERRENSNEKVVHVKYIGKHYKDNNKYRSV